MMPRRAIAIAASVASVVLPACLGAQARVRTSDVRVASEQERYLRALSALAALDGPWTLDTTRTPGVRFGGASMDAVVNSGLPSASDRDGSAWSGRGVNARASATLLMERGPWRVRLAPLGWIAQNAAFDLVPTAGAYPWQDPAVPAGIDLPQRFGEDAVARLDPGESALEFRTRRARIALTSAAAFIGPGIDHSLILQGNGGGIPRLEVGTPGGVRTRLGTFAGQVAWGRAPHTAWANDRRTGALFTSWIVGTWRPRFVERLEVGMVRLTHRDWDRMSLRELLVPFGSVYSAAGGRYETAYDNQLASVFAHLRVPEAGLEIFGEFGKNDRSAGWRDQVQEPEKSAAWLLGAQRAWRRPDGSLWSVSATAVSGSVPGISSIVGLAEFYEHSRLTQGHTLRGQLLGTPLLQREGGAEVRLDRYDARGRTGIVLGTRSLVNELAQSVRPENVRQEWSAALEMLRWTRRGAWRARLGAVADLGYSPATGDAYSVQIAIGRDVF